MTGDGREKRSVVIADNDQARTIFGRQDENLRAIEKSLDVDVYCRGGELSIVGRPEAAAKAEELFAWLLRLLDEGHTLSAQDIQYATTLVQEGKAERLNDIFRDTVVLTARGKPIRPKTLGQKRYVDAIRKHEMVFGIGPAGTGKTYLAMALAVTAFKNREVNRIILTRPAVEAGEKLGFLPGDLHEKVDPYLRPLYDALYDILGVEGFDKFMGRGMIEVAPLAYMRGRTLDDSFIILDEAQNTTPEQMKMFLTRMGFGSKVVVTGDITQVDLPRGARSGLEQVRRILAGTDGISLIYLTEQDVVRHPLVQRIIGAYEAYERMEGTAGAGPDGGEGAADTLDAGKAPAGA